MQSVLLRVPFAQAALVKLPDKLQTFCNGDKHVPRCIHVCFGKGCCENEDGGGIAETWLVYGGDLQTRFITFMFVSPYANIIIRRSEVPAKFVDVLSIGESMSYSLL